MHTLEAVNELNLSVYRIQHFDGGRLLLIGDHDLSYHHCVELEFAGVKHIHCDVDFYHPNFQDLGECGCGCTARRTGIRAARGDFEIVADSLTIAVGLVFHYERENLEPGERIAPWITRPT